MTSPVVSGIITNILARLDDESAVVYSSGKVQQAVFASLPTYNGLLGEYMFSGDVVVGQITPEISGTVFQGLLELYVAKDLCFREGLRMSRSGSLKEVSEGDSRVVMNDSATFFLNLSKELEKQFKFALDEIKFAISSQSASIVRGGDASVPLLNPIQNYYPASLR